MLIEYILLTLQYTKSLSFNFFKLFVKSKKINILFFGFFLFVHVSLVFSQQKKILVLHSYNSGLSWTDNINKGIFETFKDEFHKTLDIRCEYMDAKHFEEKSYFDFYEKYIEYKYRDIKINLIICSDNAAFDFLSKNHNAFFKNVPVVFCGVNYCDSIPKGFTGIIEDIDLYTNLKTILSIHPDYGKLYIINDRSITWFEYIQRAKPYYKNQISKPAI